MSDPRKRQQRIAPNAVKTENPASATESDTAEGNL